MRKYRQPCDHHNKVTIAQNAAENGNRTAVYKFSEDLGYCLHKTLSNVRTSKEPTKTLKINCR